MFVMGSALAITVPTFQYLKRRQALFVLWLALQALLAVQACCGAAPLLLPWPACYLCLTNCKQALWMPHFRASVVVCTARLRALLPSHHRGKGPLCSAAFALPTKSAIDKPLLVGSALFGAGVRGQFWNNHAAVLARLSTDFLMAALLRCQA